MAPCGVGLQPALMFFQPMRCLRKFSYNFFPDELPPPCQPPGFPPPGRILNNLAAPRREATAASCSRAPWAARFFSRPAILTPCKALISAAAEIFLLGEPSLPAKLPASMTQDGKKFAGLRIMIFIFS